MFSELSNRDYQITIAHQLKEKYSLDAQTEWRPMQEQKTLYSPRVDIGVGPFVYDSKCIPQQHDRLIHKHAKEIQKMLDFHKSNVDRFNFTTANPTLEEVCFKNTSARCLLAIEIEDKISRKHLIGGALNAIALGRLGIVITCSEDKLSAMFRIRKYLWFLSNATKLETDNLLILSKQQFADSFALK